MTDDDKALVERLRDFVIAEDIDLAADRIEAGVRAVLSAGLRTADIWSAGTTKVGTRESIQRIVGVPPTPMLYRATPASRSSLTADSSTVPSSSPSEMTSTSL